MKQGPSGELQRQEHMKLWILQGTQAWQTGHIANITPPGTTNAYMASYILYTLNSKNEEDKETYTDKTSQRQLQSWISFTAITYKL